MDIRDDNYRGLASLLVREQEGLVANSDNLEQV